jgi:hypothetical protein
MIAALLALAPAMAIEVDYDQFAGLKISVDGIPIVQGSSFQFYEEGWKRGIYSSNWKPKQVFKLANGLVRVRFDGDNGNVSGNLDFQKTGTGVIATYEYHWRGQQAVRLESCLGLLWYPAVESGTMATNEGAGFPFATVNPPFARPLEDRALAPATKNFQFSSPFGEMNVHMNEGGEAQIYDARNYKQDWAKGRELLWLGHMSQKIEPDQTLRYQVEWKITPAIHGGRDSRALTATAAPLSEAMGAPRTSLPIIPQPKQVNLTAGRVEVASFHHAVNEALQPIADQFDHAVWQRWRKPGSGPTVDVDAQVQASALPPEGYQLSVQPGQVTLRAPSSAGLRNGYQTLLWLVRAENGRLVLPVGEIKDWPSVGWRGVHMFVGPTALDFQGRLMDRLLGPLKFNNAVLQCERTNWLATPGIETGITMERAQLRDLFNRYRAHGIEPAPLIESLGHVGWLFENKQNLDLALNSEVPFTIDPRKEKSRQLLRSIWTEAVALLQPKTVHFGLDEIDNRGLPTDPYFTTRLWKQHIPFLTDMARELNVQPMMWGDILLGPNEGVDAMHAKTVEEAKERRAAVPKGVFIADWHYGGGADPASYKSLKLFKDSGLKPIASSWNQPNNIRGHTLAAVANGAGTLQTTWAGYESSEINMIKQFPQFASYVLAADYAWSGRQEMPDKLGYDPADVLRRLYFAPPESATSVAGQAVLPEGCTPGPKMSIDAARFTSFQPPLVLNTPLYPEGVEAPATAILSMGGLGASEIALAVDCLAWVTEGDSVGSIDVVLEDGQVVHREAIYGLHVRANRDERTTMISARENSLAVLRIALPAGAHLKEIRLTTLSKTAGLRVHGITAVAP